MTKSLNAVIHASFQTVWSAVFVTSTVIRAVWSAYTPDRLTVTEWESGVASGTAPIDVTPTSRRPSPGVGVGVSVGVESPDEASRPRQPESGTMLAPSTDIIVRRFMTTWKQPGDGKGPSVGYNGCLTPD